MNILDQSVCYLLRTVKITLTRETRNPFVPSHFLVFLKETEE